MKNYTIGIVVLVIVAIAIWYFASSGNLKFGTGSPLGTSDVASPEANALGADLYNKVDIGSSVAGQIPNTNPFAETKTNPYASGYVNPFGK
ncbi:MAG: hypothetical protein AAB682_01900 [Patescibacteria group bacterium]